MKRISHWIGGKSVAVESGRQGEVFDPARGRQTAMVDLASAADVDVAVAAARDAFSEWRASSLSTRTAIMFRFRELLDSHRRDLAAAVTAEHGKVLSDAIGEVARGIENVEYSCGIAQHLTGG